MKKYIANVGEELVFYQPKFDLIFFAKRLCTGWDLESEDEEVSTRGSMLELIDEVELLGTV